MCVNTYASEGLSDSVVASSKSFFRTSSGVLSGEPSESSVSPNNKDIASCEPESAGFSGLSCKLNIQIQMSGKLLLKKHVETIKKRKD